MYNSTKKEGGYLIRLIRGTCKPALLVLQLQLLFSSIHHTIQVTSHCFIDGVRDLKDLIFILSASNVSIDHDMNGSLAVEVTAIAILHHF